MDLKHWKLTVDGDQLAWLYFDRAGAGTNTFSSEVLRELSSIADHLVSMPPKGLAILSSKENGFAAGATAGWRAIRFSTSSGLNFTPPRLIRSRVRPASAVLPLASARASR